MRKTILFKKADFKQSNFFNPYDCPIARALRREYPGAERITVGGKTITIIKEDSTVERFSIGELRMNGALMSPRGLSTPVLSHIHQAIRYKHFLHAGVELTNL